MVEVDGGPEMTGIATLYFSALLGGELWPHSIDEKTLTTSSYFSTCSSLFSINAHKNTGEIIGQKREFAQN